MNRAKFYYTYVLKSSIDNELYIGWTYNLKERLLEHNSGEVYSTKNRIPLELVYYEGCLSKDKAVAREKNFKNRFRKKIFKKKNLIGPVAQLVEQYPFKVLVQGSSPCGITFLFFTIGLVLELILLYPG